MTRNILGLLLCACALMSTVASARDDRLKFPLADAISSENFKAKLDGNVRFFFGGQKHAEPVKHFGTFTANKKTNALNKGDKEGCEWVLLDAMLGLQERARKEGGNAVVNIHSVYRNDDLASETEYECGVGTFVTGVALRGDVVKLP